ncbi:STAS domain-containing protein [Actinacidiphila sp. bgisy167]|uniref:STAS domain-containing protein n=1 Tax=Actinacidiphila sp. bgisy167 TaxID=3413797 RepID=UPI003D717A43
MQNLGITVSEERKLTTIILTGELDLDTCPRVTAVTDTLPLGGRTLRVDLSDVTFIGSTSLNMLLSLRLRAEAEMGSLELTGLRHQAERVLALTGTRHLFRILPGAPPAALGDSAFVPAAEG